MSEGKSGKTNPRADAIGTLSDCLVDGNPEQNAREKRIKRRALTISIALQTAGLAALLVGPLLAKPAELAIRTVPPMPIYSSRPPVARHNEVRTPPRPNAAPCYSCATNRPVPTVVDRTPPAETSKDPGEFIPGGLQATDDAIPLSDPRKGPVPPQEEPPTPKIVHVTHLDPALLTHRVEPMYPALARQTRRSGKVELRALIGSDGSVQSLQVVSGDPLFVPSALEAVRQWHYKPTMLNGVAVEVDTYITVIYTLQQ
jgi:protein TonB